MLSTSPALSSDGISAACAHELSQPRFTVLTEMLSSFTDLGELQLPLLLPSRSILRLTLSSSDAHQCSIWAQPLTLLTPLC